MSPPAVWVVLPGDIDDPATPSGGNTYDRRACLGLAAAGWSVRELPVAGGWPHPDQAARTALVRALSGVPDGSVVLLDGLVACAVPDLIGAEADRLRPVVLVHLPLADETGLSPDLAAALNAGERTALRAATAVVATSSWTARRLAVHHGLAPAVTHVVRPGVDPAPPAPGGAGGALLCVASLTPRKGHDLLVRALAEVADRPWTCRFAGAADHTGGHARRLRRLIAEHRLDDRVRLVGALAGTDLAAAYAGADLLVLPSRAEPYGMVVTEALARGVPVLATGVDGVPEALGRAPDGSLPGMLIPPEDPVALAGALRRWLGQPALRRRLRESALARRQTLDGWDATTRGLAEVLTGVLAGPVGRSPDHDT